MFKNKFFLTLSVVSLFISGCDKKKDPIQGNREPLLVESKGLIPSTFLKKLSIKLNGEIKNKSWSQSSGNSLNNSPNLYLPKNLVKKWSVSSPRGESYDTRITANIVTSEDKIFALDSHGQLFAFSYDGKEMWKKNTSVEGKYDETLGGGIAFSNENVIVATSFGNVNSYNSKTGEKIWSACVKSPCRVSPTINSGKVYVVTVNNEIICLDESTGKVLWSHVGIVEPSSLLGGASPAVNSNVVVVAYSSGEVYALNPENGYEIWSYTVTAPLRYDTVSSIAHIRARPIIYGNNVFVISHGGRMVCIDLETGMGKYQKNIGGIRTPVINENVLYMLTNENDIVAIDSRSFDIYWSKKLKTSDENNKNIRYAGPVIAGGNLIITSTDGNVYMVNPRNGKIVNSIKVGESISLSPIISNSMLLTMTSSGKIFAYSSK